MTSLDVSLPPRRALLSPPCVFSPLGLVGTWPNPARLWPRQVALSRGGPGRDSPPGLQARSLPGSPSSGPKQDGTQRESQRRGHPFPPQICTSVSGFPRRDLGARRQAGEGMARRAIAERRHTRWAQAAAWDKAWPSGAIDALRRSATPARWPEGAANWKGPSAQGGGCAHRCAKQPPRPRPPPPTQDGSCPRSRLRAPHLRPSRPGALTRRPLGYWTLRRPRRPCRNPGRLSQGPQDPS